MIRLLAAILAGVALAAIGHALSGLPSHKEALRYSRCNLLPHAGAASAPANMTHPR